MRFIFCVKRPWTWGLWASPGPTASDRNSWLSFATPDQARVQIGDQNILRKPIMEEDLLKPVTRTVLRPKRVVWAPTYFGFDGRDKSSFGYLGPQRRTDDNVGEEAASSATS
jgi:hypothetical protein